MRQTDVRQTLDRQNVRRQTDVRRASSLNASALWGRGHNNIIAASFQVDFSKPVP